MKKPNNVRETNVKSIFEIWALNSLKISKFEDLGNVRLLIGDNKSANNTMWSRV